MPTSNKKIPLNWLQAFEAAGRLGTFKAAAEELHVSPSNISHQIRDLEAYLGTPLFSRSGRDVTLTTEGQQLLPDLTASFTKLRQATAPLVEQTDSLHIGAFPFLANEILAPNILLLSQATQVNDIALHTHTDLHTLTHTDPRQRLDLIVRYGPKTGHFEGLYSYPLANVALVPITGPGSDVSTVDQFLKAPFIRVIGPFEGWAYWANQFASNAEPATIALQTDSFHAAMLSVEKNEGVCLGVLPYIKPWVHEGRIKALDQFAVEVEDQAAFAVTAPFKQGHPIIETTVNWLRDMLA